MRIAWWVKRLVIGIPTILVTSVVAFFMMRSSPQDEASLSLERKGVVPDRFENYAALYEAAYRSLDLHKPIFYFSILPNTHHPNIRSIDNPQIRNLVRTLTAMHYHYQEVLGQVLKQRLVDANDPADLQVEVFIQKTGLEPSTVHFPVFTWHGRDNQYHLWIGKLLRLEWGTSFHDGIPVLRKISKALGWTVGIISFSLMLTLVMGISLGIVLARWPQSLFSKIMDLIIGLSFATPSFWLASMMLVFFCTDVFGLKLFHVNRLFFGTTWSISFIWYFLEKIAPAVVLLTTIESLFVGKMIQSKYIELSQQPFVTALRAKGLSLYSIFRHHLLKPAISPIFTSMLQNLPQAIAGSLILELVFNIPGMGRLILDSLRMADWPVVSMILLSLSIFTMWAFIFADVLLYKLDPRVKLA